MDMILNGQATGNVAARLLNNGFDLNSLRPYRVQNKRTGSWGSYMNINEGGVLRTVQIAENAATLPYDTWKEIDKTVERAARSRLRAVADLRTRGLTRSLTNAMGKTSLLTQTGSRMSEAKVRMSPEPETEADRPEFELANLPLPIIDKDFSFNIRELEASRNGDAALDMYSVEEAARNVAEAAEKLLIGTHADFKHAGGTVYGYLNFPYSTPAELSDPDDTGWTRKQIVQDVLAMRQQSYDKNRFGPWMVYTSPYWDTYLDDDYSDEKGDNTVRERIKKIEGIIDVKTLDFLTGKRILLVQMTSDVVQEVVGFDTTTIQWESAGGMRLHFKVIAMMVPLLRRDFNGSSGIISGAVPA